MAIFVNGICRGCGRSPNNRCDILRKLVLVSFPVGEKFVKSLYYGSLQILFIDRPGMALKTCRF